MSIISASAGGSSASACSPGLLSAVALILLPFKLLAARAANRRMNAYFQEHGIGWGLIRPGSTAGGLCLHLPRRGNEAVFGQAAGLGRREGLRVFDSGSRPPGRSWQQATRRAGQLGEVVECDEAELRKRLAALPRSTTNRRGTAEGDPLNLVVIGDFDTILNGFGAAGTKRRRSACARAGGRSRPFCSAADYRYSPVSSLYVDGPQPGLRAPEGAADDQRTAPPAAVADAAALPGQAGLDRPDQPGHRRALHAENLEPDHAQDRSRCR